MLGVGKDSYHNTYVLDAIQRRLTFRQQVELIEEKARQNQPVRVVVESNAYQAALVQDLADFVPAVPIKTVKDKVTRAATISAKFEAGQVLLGPGQ